MIPLLACSTCIIFTLLFDVTILLCYTTVLYIHIFIFYHVYPFFGAVGAKNNIGSPYPRQEPDVPTA